MAEMSGRNPSDPTAGTHGAAEAGRVTGAGRTTGVGHTAGAGHATGAAGAGAGDGVRTGGGVRADGAVGDGGAAGTGAGSGTACPEVIRRALAAHTTLTLAYVDEGGPQACAVLYATGGATASSGPAPDHAPDGAPGHGPDLGSGPALYFVTATTTRHGRALAEPDARVAFTVQRDGQEWGELTGIQGRGRCRILAGAERAAGWRVYTERFPFVEQSDRLRDALERTTLWELRPDWLRLIDNGQGFGHKEEWQRPEGQPLS